MALTDIPPGSLEIRQSLEPEFLNAFQVFLKIQKSKEEEKPFSLIRLGDGEASILGYPQLTCREDVAVSMWSWFDKPAWEWRMTSVFKAVRDLAKRRFALSSPPPPNYRPSKLGEAMLDLVHPNRAKHVRRYDPPRIRIGFTKKATMKPKSTWREKDVLALSDALKHSVANADIVGVPSKNSAPLAYATIETSLLRYNLLAESALLTHANIHRFLNDALLYRPILEKLDFLGIISAHDIEENMKKILESRMYNSIKCGVRRIFPITY